MYFGLHVKYLLFLSDLNDTWVFSTYFQISWKSVQWEPSCFMRTDGRTDMTKITISFRNFGKASKNNNNFPWSFLITKVFIESEAQLHHLQCHSRDTNGFQLYMLHICKWEAHILTVTLWVQISDLHPTKSSPIQMELWPYVAEVLRWPSQGLWPSRKPLQ